MRPIKFRAWDKLNNKMRPVWSLHLETDQDGEICIEVAGKAIVDMEGNHDCHIDVLRGHNFELMQFTGLHDKNGKEIWEGDIVRLGDNAIHEGVLVECRCLENRVAFYYRFITGENKGKWTDMVDDWRTYEVLGNIYENPELLK